MWTPAILWKWLRVTLPPKPSKSPGSDHPTARPRVFCTVQEHTTLSQSYKIPVSVLVVIYTATLEVLLLERADVPGFWQSVTGSCDSPEEALELTAQREVMEETGLDTRQFELTNWHCHQDYDIYPRWRHRYAPGVTHNREHVFGLLVPQPQPVTLSPREHLNWRWLPWHDAAMACFSSTNREAILTLPSR